MPAHGHRNKYPEGRSSEITQRMLELGTKAYTAIYGTGGSQANAGTAMAKAAYGYGMSIAYGNYKAQPGNAK